MIRRPDPRLPLPLPTGGGDRVTVLERAVGIGRVRVAAHGIAELYQEGALRLRHMRGDGTGRGSEIVAINTAGGLTSGDALHLRVEVDRGATAILTTPACEKIYRSRDTEAVVANAVRVAPDARLEWLPQPMILFDGAQIRRRLEVDIAANAVLLAVEGVILGRTAMGEEIKSGSLRDSWRIRREGRLVYADGVRFDGNACAELSGAAALQGARAFATIVVTTSDGEHRLEEARDLLGACSSATGASAWNGLLVVRFLARDGQVLVSDLTAFLGAFRKAPLPRSWLC